MASVSVATRTRRIDVRTPARSRQFGAGTRNVVAPAFSAPAIFSWMPPIPPTTPVGLIVPVPATCWPAKSSPGVVLS
jgi:hypothetical protein